jgi:tripartite-type tricarboxylate transporter receptor subunit TctC
MEPEMRFPRREFLKLILATAGMPVLPRLATALDYPTRPVRIICGFPPGGVNDLHARLMGQWLSERLGQQFVIENRTGAGGSIAAEAVVRSPADGYTLLLASASDSWNVNLYDNPNSIREIAPVSGISRFAGTLLVNPSFPARTVNELIAAAKANPGKISMASAGIGSAAHIWWELFKNLTGVDMLHVPYRGEGPALTDLIGGQVQVMIPSLPPSIEHIRAGKLRPLAVTAAKPVDALPGIPTIGESVPGYEGNAWVGVGAPKNTPAEIVIKLNQEINLGLIDKRISDRFAELGEDAFPGTPAEFGAFISDFTGKWGKVIRMANIKL